DAIAWQTILAGEGLEFTVETSEQTFPPGPYPHRSVAVTKKRSSIGGWKIFDSMEMIRLVMRQLEQALSNGSNPKVATRIFGDAPDIAIAPIWPQVMHRKLPVLVADEASQ